MESIDLLIHEWKQKGKPIDQRLGQFFVNYYIDEAWPELYYEEDTYKAMQIIRQWLEDYCYTDGRIPQKLY